jgi:hypothetical protein
MKELYLAIRDRLKEKVPALKWIDLDLGQLDTYTHDGGLRPPIAFPAVLVEMAVGSANTLWCNPDTMESAQRCTAGFTIRIVQQPPTWRTSQLAPDDACALSLAAYDLIDDVINALQGYNATFFEPLSRTSQSREGRADGLFVYRANFTTGYEQTFGDV